MGTYNYFVIEGIENEFFRKEYLKYVLKYENKLEE